LITANSFERTIGGRKLIIESGKMARLADAAVTIRYADTELLVTLCAAKKPREGVDFLPLTDYRLRRADVCRRQNPRRVYPPRRTPQ